MSTFGEQLKILLHKNIIIKKRKRNMTLLELLYPLYFIVIMYVTKTLGGSEITISEKAVPFYEPIVIPPLSSLTNYYPGSTVLAYAPDYDNVVNSLIGTLQVQNNLSSSEVMGFSSFDDLTSYYFSYMNSLWGGLNFTTLSNENDAVTANYAIAFNSSAIPNDNSAYAALGYSSLQVSLLQALMSKWGPGVTLNFTATEFPTPASERKINLFVFILPVYFAFMFIYSIQQLSIAMITEKEIKIRESFKIMGTRPIASYIAWFITQTTLNLASIVIVTIALYALGLVKYTSPVTLVVVLLLYTATLNLVGFLFTIFIEVPRIGTVATSLYTLIALGVWEILHFFVFDKNNSFGLRFVCSLINQVPFDTYISNMAQGEWDKTGVQLGDQAFLEAVLFLSVDIVLYLILVWYLDNTYVGSLGVAKPLYFPLMKSYWASAPSSSNRSINSEHTSLLSSHSQSQSDSGGVTVTDLRKEYDNGVKAVNGLTLHIQRGEILALLGHNGAGKSTTINILTGLFPPTSGSINIMGYNYTTQMEEIRKIVGYCPQHNVLLDQLTCAEHLYVFGKIKGVPESVIHQEIDAKLEEVGLSDKKDTLSAQLSGGMKRKLSIAIAFIGDSSLIFLDECTAGMDPYSRRKIWQLLQKYKSQKTIIMTTHFMEEAELLGDQIAIMAKGKLRCSGTSLQLKNQFGVGYILRFVKEHESADMTHLDKLVQSFFPRCVSLPSPSALEIIYSIPNDMTNFSAFFAQLSISQHELSVRSYGLSMTTLEEVFLKIAAEDHEQQGGKIALVSF